MKKLLAMMVIVAFATTGAAFALNTTKTAQKEKTKITAKIKTTATKEVKATDKHEKEMPKGIATASMEGQGKKIGLMQKWFGWMTPSKEKTTKEAETTKSVTKQEETKKAPVTGEPTKGTVTNKRDTVKTGR